MNTSQKLLWNLYAGAVGALTTVVAAKAVNAAWQLATGNEPPEPNDPNVPLRRALTGRDHGPDMAELLPLIAKDQAIARLSIS